MMINAMAPVRVLAILLLHPAFINTYIEFTVSENDYSSNGNGCSVMYPASLWAWEVLVNVMIVPQ